MSRISVIIPTYNRAHWIEETLEAMTRLETRELDWEVLLVDNNSNDGTKIVVENFVGLLPLRYVFEPRQGKNVALNTAIEWATGDLLVFADDDITPDPSWLMEIANASDRWPDSLAFGGKITPAFPDRTPKMIREADFSNMLFATMAPPQPEGPFPAGITPNGPNCWVRRRLFDLGWRYDNEIGPRGTGRVSGSELEFFLRLRSQGIEPVYVPSASVLHRVQPYQTKLAYLLRRGLASGRGTVRIFGVPETCPRWFGVPRYLYRGLAGEIGHALLRIALLDAKRTLEHAIKFTIIAGAIAETKVESRRSTTRAVAPRSDTSL